MRATIATVLSGIILVTIGAFVVRSEENPHGKLAWDCTECHSTVSWKHLADSTTFEHNETGFRLDGAHRDVSCVSCHRELVFSHVGIACADCHADHHLGQLGSNCQNCHITRDWQPQTDLLNQHADRGFPLTGVHAVADCDACHRTGDRREFVGTPTECQSCHLADLARAVDPDHTALAFDNDCRLCHHAAFGSWEQTTYQHPSSFPLTGAHTTIRCGACHANTFSGTPTGCYDCHSDDYTSAVDPNHVLSGFSTSCADCHTTTAWQPATFDHDLTGFPLDGRHLGLNCNSCHQTTYAGTPTDCYACHKTDYDATVSPSHTAALFPTTCVDCHSTAGWVPSTWDHDAQYFPIYSGAHRGRWSDCTECHTVPGSFANFECIACHAHNQTDMDDKHSGVGDYQYLSSACYNCHPTGRH